jgi:hypothetical protein
MVAIGNNKILMFGGRDAAYSCNNETWIYDTQQQRWNNLTLLLSTAPSPRAFFSMAVDTAHNKVVLFGGSDGSNLSDTWVFDIAQSSWSLCLPSSHPSARTGTAMAFNASNNLVYLFGGDEGSTRKQDMWSYDVGANTWTDRTPATGKPAPRDNAGMFYDSLDSRHPMVLFGGGDGSAQFFNDMWYFTAGQWTSGTPLNAPTARKGMGISYIPGMNETLLFGGFDATTTTTNNDMYYYAYRSTGTFTSPVVDVPFTTSLQWLQMQVTPTSAAPGTTLKYQLSSSMDKITWSDFYGPDGDANSYYNGDVNGAFVITAEHNDHRYLRYRAYLASSQPPNSPQIDGVTLTFNRSPGAPVPATPFNGDTTNYVKPYFTWINSGDSDNDTLTYQLQVGNDSNFNAPITISTGSIPQGGGAYTTFVATTALDNGAWYWRVRANDGTIDGAWSGTCTLNIDTIAPAAVADLSAQTGPGNGQVTLRWTATGNNNATGGVSNGLYEIRFSTNGSLDGEAAYAAVTASRTIADSFSPGQPKSIAVSGLAAGATYYFALKERDDAGNYSPLSLTSPSALTNAPPVVQLLSPVGGENWTGTQQISWNSSDSNPGDTRTFNLYTSCDSGATYDVTIATGLPNGTTYYLFDTRWTCNGADHRVKVTATDAMGATGTVVSPVDFTVFNPNQAPVVTVVNPASGTIVSGPVTLQWAVVDFNKSDTQTFDVYLSSDSGNTYGWHFTTFATTYTVNSSVFPNGSRYRLKVRSTDSGTPPASGEDAGRADFIISNGNLPPNAFALLAPPDGSARSLLGMDFSWENNGDPNTGDSLIYTLMYSTSSDLSRSSIIDGITGNACHLAYASLVEETTYYWKVTARDQLGAPKECGRPFAVYALSRFKTVSTDGKIFARIDALPDNGFLMISKVDPSAVRAISAANADARSDRHLKSLNGDVYQLSVCDVGGNQLAVAEPRITLSMQYADTGGKNYYDGTLVPVANLKCALLNETLQQWEPLPQPPVIDIAGKQLSSTLTRLGMVTLIGASTPVSKLSGVVNYPNPFCAGQEETRVRYILTEDSDVSIHVYTLTGNLVWEMTLPAGKEGGKGQPTGYTNEILWDGRNNAGMTVANGMYLMEIKAGSARQIRKIGIIK